MESFRDMRAFPEIKDKHDEKDFTQMIKAVKVRHNNVVPMMALGVNQLKKGLKVKMDYEDLDEIHQFLDRFYLSRIGIRMLIGKICLWIYISSTDPFCFCCIILLYYHEIQGSMLSCILQIHHLILWGTYTPKCLLWR